MFQTDALLKDKHPFLQLFAWVFPLPTDTSRLCPGVLQTEGSYSNFTPSSCPASEENCLCKCNEQTQTYLPLGGGVFTMFSEIMIKIGFVAMGILFTL